MRSNMILLARSILLGLALGPPGVLWAQQPHRDQLAQKFQTRLAAIADTFPGVIGVHVIDLEAGRRFGVNDALVFPQGSSIKIPILLELYRQAESGEAPLEERVVVDAAVQTGGSGILESFAGGGSALSLHDLAVLMIVLSDNTATNMLIDRLGMERINRTMAELGLPQTRVQRRMIQPEQSARGNENLSTPREAADLMARIARCELPMGEEACGGVRRILEIPKGGGFPDAIPSGIPVAWKPGGIEGVSVAWGLVDLPTRPYVVAVMTNYGRGDGGAAIRAVSRAAYDYFERLARSTPHGARVPLDVYRRVPPDTARTR